MAAHPGNERAKFYIRMVGPEVLTEGGINQQLARRDVRRWAGARAEWRGEVRQEGSHQIYPLQKGGKNGGRDGGVGHG